MDQRTAKEKHVSELAQRRTKYDTDKKQRDSQSHKIRSEDTKIGNPLGCDVNLSQMVDEVLEQSGTNPLSLSSKLAPSETQLALPCRNPIAIPKHPTEVFLVSQPLVR